MDLDAYMENCYRDEAREQCLQEKFDELAEALHGRIYINGERGVVALCDEAGATLCDEYLDKIASPVAWVRERIRDEAEKRLSD
jgi:hypothetical protein